MWGEYNSLVVTHRHMADKIHTEIAQAKADACRHDRHSWQSVNTHAGNVVKTQQLSTRLHTTAGGAVSPGVEQLMDGVGVGLAFQVKEVVTCPSSRPINQRAQPHIGWLLGKRGLEFTAHAHTGLSTSLFSHLSSSLSHTHTHTQSQ